MSTSYSILIFIYGPFSQRLVYFHLLTSSLRVVGFRGVLGGLKECVCFSLPRAQECIFRLYRLRCAGKPEKRTWHRKRAQQSVLSLSHTLLFSFFLFPFSLRDIHFSLLTPFHILFNESFSYFYLYFVMFDICTKFI